MFEDVVLLRAYAEKHSEAAFAELVQRRIGLVYSIAFRQVGGDAHLAHDVTQKVFVALARKAAALVNRPAIGGWLYRTTHFTAVDLIRSERRRRAREQHSQLMPADSDSPAATTRWDKLQPLLDEAMSTLSDRDRDAVALRFFEGRAFAEIGRTLRLTEEAARKRVERALDKMAAALSRRGVTSTSAALSIALAEQAAFAAPTGMATTVTGTALAGAAVGAGWNLSGFLGSAKVTGSFGVAALVAVGVAMYETNHAQKSIGQMTAAVDQRDRARAEAADVRHRLTMAEERARAAEDDNAKLLAAIESFRVSRNAAALASSAQRPGSRPNAEATNNTETAAAEPQVHLRLIQLTRKVGETDAVLANQANIILTRFRNGEKFEDLAREFSGDLKRAKGGDWGWMKPDDFKSNFRDIAFNLKKGETSSPVLLPEGCFILYAENRK